MISYQNEMGQKVGMSRHHTLKGKLIYRCSHGKHIVKTTKEKTKGFYTKLFLFQALMGIVALTVKKWI